MKRRRDDEMLCLKVESEHAEVRRETLFVNGELEDIAVGLGVAYERRSLAFDASKPQRPFANSQTIQSSLRSVISLLR
jgi:hypothetical protein